MNVLRVMWRRMLYASGGAVKRGASWLWLRLGGASGLRAGGRANRWALNLGIRGTRLRDRGWRACPQCGRYAWPGPDVVEQHMPRRTVMVGERAAMVWECRCGQRLTVKVTSGGATWVARATGGERAGYNPPPGQAGSEVSEV